MLREFELDQLAEPLLHWFVGHARVLPWRSEPTPYRVWVSEIMLQQTRVEAVKPYFERFLKKLPDVRALAECPEDVLLKLWEGLGYYNRVRNMQKAAIQVTEEYGGMLPSEYDELRKLKGIGNYTAGAIASIAYGRPAPAVDGNVLRVLTRVTADDTDIMKQSFKKELEGALLALMGRLAVPAELKKRLKDGNVPGALNQALMELGATVCVPNGAPSCEACPWKPFCLARQQGRIEELPVKSKAKARRIEERTVLIIRDGDKVAIRKRPDTGLLAGLYELPNVLGSLAGEEAVSYVKGFSFVPIRVKELGEAKHVFSHVEWHMKGYAVLVQEAGFSGSGMTCETDRDVSGVREKADGGDGREAADGEAGEEKEKQTPSADELLFVDAEDAQTRYAIPKAFAAYAEYLNIRLGNERFEAPESEGGS